VSEPNSLTAFSDALADAVAKAAESTVTVNARRRLPASGVAWTADGVVVTADHVIERDEQITVVLPDGTEAAATIAGRDPGSDIAVLRVAAALTPIARGDQVRIGHPVLAVGRPQGGGEVMASFGVVGALGGAWRTAQGSTVEGYIRADATLYPGFSGGPLVDVEGRAVGLNSSRLGRGAGLTIPVAALALVVDALLRSGRIRRGYLGVVTQVARLAPALAALASGRETGLLIVNVEPGSPADAAGLITGDILVAFDGQATADTEDLQAALGAASVGKGVQLTLLRGGQATAVAATVGERK
jgi:S1-C subfamily serine protease